MIQTKAYIVFQMIHNTSFYSIRQTLFVTWS